MLQKTEEHRCLLSSPHYNISAEDIEEERPLLVEKSTLARESPFPCSKNKGWAKKAPILALLLFKSDRIISASEHYFPFPSPPNVVLPLLQQTRKSFQVILNLTNL
ncbi:hypothetical protein TNCV_3159681 [Trichonephila clavipes]|nr:hypothetical protein TNCV_3159681 [Trichonephila clavipes]